MRKVGGSGCGLVSLDLVIVEIWWEADVLRVSRMLRWGGN